MVYPANDLTQQLVNLISGQGPRVPAVPQNLQAAQAVPVGPVPAHVPNERLIMDLKWIPSMLHPEVNQWRTGRGSGGQRQVRVVRKKIGLKKATRELLGSKIRMIGMEKAKRNSR